MEKRVVLANLLLILWTTAHVSEKPRMTAEEFEASLKFRQGEIILPGGMATLRIPHSFRYLPGILRTPYIITVQN